jgi:phosphoglycolate phosphatase-like HAD superfamily hydrolase
VHLTAFATGSFGTLAYDLVIFDLDGTIVDGDEAMAVAFERAYRHIYPTAKEIRLHELQICQGIPFQQIVQELGWEPDLSTSFKKESLAQIDEVRLFPDVGGVLDSLHRMNIKLAILTGKDRERTIGSARTILYHGPLGRHCVRRRPLAGQAFSRRFELYHRRSGNCRERCVFIGDAPNDLAAPNACVEFIGVRWAGQPDHLSDAERIGMLNTLSDLLDYLEASTTCAISS